MKATKEAARRCRDELDTIGEALYKSDVLPHLAEEIKFIEEFLYAAERELPREAKAPAKLKRGKLPATYTEGDEQPPVSAQ